MGENLLGLGANNNQVGDFLNSSLQTSLYLKYKELTFETSLIYQGLTLRQLTFFGDSSEPDPKVGLHPAQFWQS